MFIQTLLFALLEAGYGVYAHDHKGHGKTVKREEDYGHFKPNVGWNEAVSDVIFVSETVRKEQTCPLFLLGHSMGSFYQDVLCNLEANYMMDF